MEVFPSKGGSSRLISPSLCGLHDSSVPSYTYANKTKVNHLSFMDDLKLYARSETPLVSMIQSVRISCSNNIGMKFGVEKCAILVLKRVKLAQTEGITLPEGTTIKAMEESEGYKYPGVLEASDMLHD